MDARRWRWMVEHTGADNTRAMAVRCGVSHTTIQRWLSNGIPVKSLTDLMFRFRADPIEAYIAWGFLTTDDVPHLNYEALVQYVPLCVLTKELDRRVSVYAQTRPDSERKWGVAKPLRLA